MDPSDKANYRPVSILPLVSKVFEKTMYDQLYEYIEHFPNQLLCGSRKAQSTQHALFRLVQKWQKELDSGGKWYNFNGIVKSLWLLTSWFIAKLEAYGLDNGSLTFFYITSVFEKKELKLVPLIVNGQKLDVELLKGQY